MDDMPFFLFLPSLGPLEIAALFIIVLILFGPGKLPQVFGALGDGIRQFKKASKDISEELSSPPPSQPEATPTHGAPTSSGQ